MLDIKSQWTSLFLQGKIREAYYLKKLYLEKISLQSYNSLLSIEEKLTWLKACMWLEELTKINIALENTEISDVDKKKLRFLEIIKTNFSILNNDIVTQPPSLSNPFYNYISGKNIAIVGPTQTDNNYGVDIDNHDVVIRLSHHEENFSKEDKSKFGFKTHISYYSKQNFIQNFSYYISLLENNKLLFIVVNGWKESDCPYAIDRKILNCIKAPAPFILHYDAPLLAIPRCLYDILLCNPRNITIYNTDFYTHYPYYKINYPIFIHTQKELLQSWSIHDIIFNFNVCKLLARNNKIKGDKIFQGAIHLEIDDYLTIIEQNLSKMQETSFSL